MKRNLLNSSQRVIVFESGYHQIIFLSEFCKPLQKRKNGKKEAILRGCGKRQKLGEDRKV